MLLRSGFKYYEEGDKAGRLLAHQLKQESSSHQILQIKSPLGTTTDPKQINDHFKDYYNLLYTVCGGTWGCHGFNAGWKVSRTRWLPGRVL